MKPYLLFALIDLLLILIYPLVYILHYMRKWLGEKPHRR